MYRINVNKTKFNVNVYETKAMSHLWVSSNTAVEAQQTGHSAVRFQARKFSDVLHSVEVFAAKIKEHALANT